MGAGVPVIGVFRISSILCLSLVGLTGCSISDVARTDIDQARGLWQAVIHPATLPKSTPDQSGDLYVSLPEQEWEGAFQPVVTRGDTILWQSGAQASITTRNGVIVATRGLGDDLMSADVSDLASAIRFGGRAEGYRENHYLDVDTQKQVRVFICDFSYDAGDLIETCYADGLEIQNTYSSRTSTGFVRSRQWIGPVLGYANLRLTP